MADKISPEAITKVATAMAAAVWKIEPDEVQERDIETHRPLAHLILVGMNAASEVGRAEAPKAAEPAPAAATGSASTSGT